GRPERIRAVLAAGGHPAGAGDGPRGGGSDAGRGPAGPRGRGRRLLLRPRRQGLFRGGPPARRRAGLERSETTVGHVSNVPPSTARWKRAPQSRRHFPTFFQIVRACSGLPLVVNVPVTRSVLPRPYTSPRAQLTESHVPVWSVWRTNFPGATCSSRITAS